MIRPYKDDWEVEENAIKHGCVLHGHPFFIKEKSNNTLFKISLPEKGVYLNKEGRTISYEEMLNKYTWADGSPCGVEIGDEE